jgi:hypothetical protein
MHQLRNRRLRPQQRRPRPRHRPVAAAATPTKQPEPASPEAAASVASTSPEHTALALDPEGLRVFDTRTGASRLLRFGMAEEATVSALTSILGAGPSEQGDIEICTARFARWKSGLGVWFSEGSFTGWGVSEGATGLATVSGVKPGSTRAELEATHAASVYESSLGAEFTAGALAGVLSSDAPDARITQLWAGNTCIAR